MQMIDETPASQMSLDSDDIADRGAKKFLDMLRKIGPHSKQILNYSYPPLLYQRGEEDDEEEEHEGECDEDDEPGTTNNSHMLGDSDDMGQLPQLNDSDDEELMALEGQLPDHGISEDDQNILNRLRSVDDD